MSYQCARRLSYAIHITARCFRIERHEAVNMTDSISAHYTGSLGRQYVFARQQDRVDQLGDILQSRFFAPHLQTCDRVLDFGCGNGSIARQLQRRVRSIEGLEVNEHSREIARASGLTVHSSISAIPAGTQFDVIISNHVLEHIPDVHGTLVRLRALLALGGRLVVVLPIEDFREARNRTWRHSDTDNHLYSWTPLLFGNLLFEAGFEPLALSIIAQAQSRKLFFLGDGMLQNVAGRMLSMVKRKRQLLAIARPRAESHRSMS